MIYTNGDLTNKILPSFDQVKKYLQNANYTDLKYRDIRQLMSFLQRLPQIDRLLLGLMQTRKIAVLGFDYTIKYPDEYKPSESELKQIEAMKLRFKKSKIYAIFNNLMNGILYGASATRLVWEKTDQYGTLVTKKRHLELTELDFSFDDNESLDYIRTNVNGSFQRIPLDNDVHISTRYNPLDGIDNNFLGSILRTNMLYVLMKYTDIYGWMNANKKWGDPTILAQYNKNKFDNTELDVVKAGLENMTENYAVISDEIQVKLLEAMRSGITEMHKEFKDAINTEMAISILGQTLTTDVSKVGSFAAAKVHNFVRQDILWGDIITLQNTISDQYIQKDFDLNYGEPKNAYPVFEFITDEIQDSESNARIITELKANNVPLKKSQVYEKTGFSEPKDGEETF